jgi:hypothetical protein
MSELHTALFLIRYVLVLSHFSRAFFPLTPANFRKVTTALATDEAELDTVGWRRSKAASLVSGSGSSSTLSRAPRADEVPFVRPQATASPLVFPEVQSAVARGIADTNWTDSNFLEQIVKDPILAKGLSDPRMGTVMQEMSKNPQEALRKYGQHPELQEFMTRMMNAMGQRLAAEKQRAATASVEPEPLLREQPAKQMYVADRPREVDPRQMQQWLADPELRAILSHPETEKILAEIRTDTRKFKEYAKRADIKKLIAAGIIQSE